jgi:hypothetical protein
MADKDEAILKQAREAWKVARDYWNDNHREGKDDLRFARLGEQWPGEIKRQREREARPCETFNKMPSFIRQVVNDARQNKPSIKVHPADSNADPRTAEIINGLIRNIETISDADVAYDTAIESAVDKGFGYLRVNTRYTCDDAFDQDIVIERIMNPFTVYGDPRSEMADSSDWNECFISVSMSKEQFEKEYPDADPVDWESEDMSDWREGESVIVAEYWTRDKVKSQIVALDDGTVVKTEDLEKKPEDFEGKSVVGQPREVESYKVTQRILTGDQILKTVEWAGRYIPVIPVYGDEVIDEQGKRHFRSLIRDAKGAARMYNYMRNTGIELIALAPKVPFIGEEKAFENDPNWQTANSQSHPFLTVPNGTQIPQRQPYPGVPQGVVQEALSASDDMKSIIGIYDASLGNRSNETSGRAIRARQLEGDTATFHFIDNLSRSIRHCGRILIDLIPKVYSTERMVRILGEDMKPQNVQIAPTGQAVQEVPQLSGVTHVYDITAGKYDLVVKAGPSFGTLREETREEIVEVVRAYPDSAPILGPMYLRNSDWPGAEEAADKLEALAGGGEPQIPPEVQQQIQQGMELIQKLQAENEALKADQQGKAQERQIQQQEMQINAAGAAGDRELKQMELQIKAAELQLKQFEAETSRMQAMKPDPEPPSRNAAVN